MLRLKYAVPLVAASLLISPTLVSGGVPVVITGFVHWISFGIIALYPSKKKEVEKCT